MSRRKENCKLFAASASARREEACGGVGLRTRRLLVAAMEQQMWFFGCDAACTDGNLLTRYGFHRHRSERHRGKSSQYRFLWRPSCWVGQDGAPVETACVDLHGWCAGLHAGEGGFLYARAGHRLGWYDAPEPLVPGEYDEDPAARRAFRLLGCRPEVGFCRAAVLFLDWVDQYEDWIEQTCGPGYRRRCHARAPLPWFPPPQARSWLARYRQAVGFLSTH